MADNIRQDANLDGSQNLNNQSLIGSSSGNNSNNPLAHLSDTVNNLDPLNAIEKSLNDQMPHTPNTPHTPGSGSHPMTPGGGPPSVNNGSVGNNSPQQQLQSTQPPQQNLIASSTAEGCGTNNSNGLNLYEADLTTELGFIDGNAESDLNVSFLGALVLSRGFIN